jgi:AcrR family transcriptional regulator
MTEPVTEPIKATRGRPRSQASENAILSATLSLLADLGYRAVTIEQIASAAGVSKATIYRRWQTKENLVIAAFGKTPPLQMTAGGTIDQQLLAISKQFADFYMHTPMGGVLIALLAERHNNPTLEQELAPVIQQRRQPIIDLIDAAIARGELASNCDAALLTDSIIGPVLMNLMITDAGVTDAYIGKIINNALLPWQA